MSLIETKNTKDILNKESPWGAPNKNNKQPSSNNPDDMEDLAKKFQDGIKTVSYTHLTLPTIYSV